MTEPINIYLDDVRGGPPNPETGLWEDNPYWLVRDSFASDEEFHKDTTQWLVVRTIPKCIALLEEHAGNVGKLSLDHDMGDYSNWLPDKRRMDNGYDVLLWLEERLFNDHTFPIPQEINIHSANHGATTKMWAAVKKLETLRRSAKAQMERDARAD
jgi:hypothetical protein